MKEVIKARFSPPIWSKARRRLSMMSGFVEAGTHLGDTGRKNDVAALIAATLTEEEETDQLLTTIAESVINPKAAKTHSWLPEIREARLSAAMLYRKANPPEFRLYCLIGREGTL